MKTKKTPKSTKRVGRRWGVPPLLMDIGPGFPGLQVLQECTGDEGLSLWLALRDVMLWGTTAPENREGLFGPSAAPRRRAFVQESAVNTRVAGPVATLADMVEDPAGIEPQAVSTACRQIAAWASDAERTDTALGFAIAGATADQTSGTAAVFAGALALQQDRPQLAEAWLRRAFSLSRRTREWEAYAEAYLGLGRLEASRGRPEVAERYLIKAIRAARRNGLLGIRGRAMFEMLRIAAAAGNTEAAERYGRIALRALGRQHPAAWTIRYLLAENRVGERNGGEAFPVLRDLLRTAADETDRLRAASLLAGGAARAGDGAVFDEAWTAALRLMNREGKSRERARAILGAARAAAEMGDARKAEYAARCALDTTVQPADHRLVEEANALIPDEVQKRRAG
jgi:tetratricopeptide (TPR) repeat protein